MEIRPYREADEAQVSALWREVFPNPPAWNEPAADIRRKLTVQPELFFVAEEEGRVIGTAMGGFDGHRGWVYYVAIHPSHRRRGLGGQLMRRVEEGLAAIGCTKLNLQVRAMNREVIAFYQSLGYTVEARVSMSKRLEGAR